MWLKYFEHKGKRYYTGTVVKLRVQGYASTAEKEAVFVAHDPEEHRCLYLIKQCVCDLKENTFFDRIIEVTNRMDATNANDVYRRWAAPREVRPKRDFEVPGMLGAWIAYIVVMIGLLIFNQWYIGWIAATVIFFNYRNKMMNGK